MLPKTCNTKQSISFNSSLLKKHPFYFKNEKLSRSKKQKEFVLTKQSNCFQNDIIGLTLGFKTSLYIRGLSASWKNSDKKIQAYFIDSSHSILKKVLWNFQFKIYKKTLTRSVGWTLHNQRLKIRGMTLWSVNNFAKELRGKRKPNFYTGVGIRYQRDIIPDRALEQMLVKVRRQKRGR